MSFRRYLPPSARGRGLKYPTLDLKPLQSYAPLCTRAAVKTYGAILSARTKIKIHPFKYYIDEIALLITAACSAHLLHRWGRKSRP